MEAQSLAERNPGPARWRGTGLSPRLLALAAFALILFMAGLMVARPLIFLSVPVMSLLGFMLLAMRSPASTVTVSRRLERDHVRELDPCRVRLRVTNGGSRRISLLQIRDRLPRALEGEGVEAGFTISLRGGERRDLYYELRPPAFGLYSLGPIALAAEDGSGLIEREAVVESYSHLVVLPGTMGRLPRFAIRPRRTKPWPGEIPARRAGTGTDHHGVRPLGEGELPRRVNWRASARWLDAGDGRPFVNDFTAELGAETLIVLDGRGLSSEGRAGSLVDYSSRAALSIGERLLRDRNGVGLLVVGSRSERVPCGSGMRQFGRMAVALSRLEPGREIVSLEHLPRVVRYYFPRASQVVLISPLADGATVRAAAEIPRGGRCDLTVLSPNPLDFVEEDHGELTSRAARTAWRLAGAERRALLDLLRRSGAIVIDWRAAEPLARVAETHSLLSARRVLRPIASRRG